MTDDQLIQESTDVEHGEATRMFMESPAGVAVMKRAEQNIYDEWISSKTPEAREMAWAKSEALLAFALAIRSTVDAGKVAIQNRKVRAAQKKQQGA